MTADPARSPLLDELWNRDHRYYELARQHVHATASSPGEYDFLRAHLPAAGDILEVGCGEGSNMEVLAAPGRRFVGCDLSALALRLARDASLADGARRFVRGEGEALPFADGTFCAVMGISLLEHLPHPEMVIAEMARVLAPDGTLLLLSPQYGGPLGASPCRRGGGAVRFLRRLQRAHLPRRKKELGCTACTTNASPRADSTSSFSETFVASDGSSGRRNESTDFSRSPPASATDSDDFCCLAGTCA